MRNGREKTLQKKKMFLLFEEWTRGFTQRRETVERDGDG